MNRPSLYMYDFMCFKTYLRRVSLDCEFLDAVLLRACDWMPSWLCRASLDWSQHGRWLLVCRVWIPNTTNTDNWVEKNAARTQIFIVSLCVSLNWFHVFFLTFGSRLPDLASFSFSFLCS